MKWYQHIYGEADSRAKYNNDKDKKNSRLLINFINAVWKY